MQVGQFRVEINKLQPRRQKSYSVVIGSAQPEGSPRRMTPSLHTFSYDKACRHKESAQPSLKECPHSPGSSHFRSKTREYPYNLSTASTNLGSNQHTDGGAHEQIWGHFHGPSTNMGPFGSLCNHPGCDTYAQAINLRPLISDRSAAGAVIRRSWLAS